MSVNMAEAVAELAVMRLSNGVDRVVLVAGMLATVVEDRFPMGEDLVGGARAVLLALEAGAFAVEQGANQIL